MNAAVTPLQGTGNTNESNADDGVLVNNPDLRRAIAEAAAECNRIDAEREALNAEKQDIRADLKAKGISLKAFDAALRHSRIEDAAKREAWDTTYAICRQALGHPIQGDMFVSDAAD